MKKTTPRPTARLYVDRSTVDLSDDGLPDYPESWKINVDDPKTLHCVLLWGFARQRDAELAMQFLAGLPVYWLAPRKRMWKELSAIGYPDRPSLMKAACERLAW